MLERILIWLEIGWDIARLIQLTSTCLLYTSSFFRYFPNINFNFGVNMLNGNIDSLIANIEHYYEGFDPDYEASLWIGEDGHGKHGAPSVSYTHLDVYKRQVLTSSGKRSRM